jgi:hypothetical protein
VGVVVTMPFVVPHLLSVNLLSEPLRGGTFICYQVRKKYK